MFINRSDMTEAHLDAFEGAIKSSYGLQDVMQFVLLLFLSGKNTVIMKFNLCIKYRTEHGFILSFIYRSLLFMGRLLRTLY